MSMVKTLTHMPEKPLSIEREIDENGHEFIYIEGVKYDADYFRYFSYPETSVLYQVERVEDFVKLTVIDTREKAEEFFENA